MSHLGEESQPSLTDQVAALRQQLAQSQKLTALGELVGTTTHEFNNILMTIINYAKMGQRHKDEATRDKAFQKILDAGNRAAKITNSILGYARNRAATMEPTDLTKVVDDSLLLLERELQKYRIQIDRQCLPVPNVIAHGNQIQQVLINLLINARQAMPSGGVVLVKLAPDATNQYVELTVRDTGCGMSQETMRKIFQPFFTTKSGPDASGKGGTGLGLSACRDIIEAHQGRIRVESSVGRGTAFILKLPIQTAGAKNAPAAAPIAPAPAPLNPPANHGA